MYVAEHSCSNCILVCIHVFTKIKNIKFSDFFF
jgi:hypothetical protein